MAQDFELVSHRLGALPLVNHVCQRLRLHQLLDAFVPRLDARQKLPPAVSLGLLMRTLALGKQPLYEIARWAARWEPGALALNPSDLDWLSDDRVGRTLDRLFDADRASLLTEITLRTVREFEVSLERLHNDSTSITLSGSYREATGRKLRGKQAPEVTWGFNKDHRPDLKQLLFVLTVAADGSIPIHHKAWDGGTNDSETHLSTWQALTKMVGSPDYLYVADSKLCDRDTMLRIDRDRGRFLTVLPRSRQEDGWFRKWVQSNQPAWEEVASLPHPRRKDGPRSVWRAFESPVPSAEGFRVVWVWNSLKEIEDQRSRQERIERAVQKLEALNQRLQSPRTRMKTVEPVEAAIADAIDGASGWVEVTHDQLCEPTYRKIGRGRPGPNSRYERAERRHFTVTWKVNQEAVGYDARSDGMYPLITNDRALTPAQVWEAYKYQPQLEKRHQALKSVLEVAPVWLKNEGRIEAILFLYYLALLVHALLERELKRAMTAAGLLSLPLYPEGRRTANPSAELILSLFEDLQVHHLFRSGRFVQTFLPELTPLQQQVLALLSVPADDFLRCRPHNPHPEVQI